MNEKIKIIFETTLYVVLILILTYVLISNANCQQNLFKDNFEEWGWWYNWDRLQLKDSVYEVGPNRARYYRKDLNDNSQFSAFFARRSIFHIQPSDNYESTYVSNTNTIISKKFFIDNYNKSYIELNFKYYISLLYKDTFFVYYHYTKNSEKIPLFEYSPKLTGDTISNSAKWYSFSKIFIADKVPFTISFEFKSANTVILKAGGVWLDNVEVNLLEPVIVYSEWDNERFISTLNIFQNYPNPFNKTTNILVSAKKACPATLMIFNSKGQLVYKNNYIFEKGDNTIRIDFDDNLASGVYMYSFAYNDIVLSKKMIYLK